MESPTGCFWRTAIFVDFDNLKRRGDSFWTPDQIIAAIHHDLNGLAIVQYGHVYYGTGLPDDPAPLERGKIHQIYSHGLTPVPAPSFKGNGIDIKDITDSCAQVDIVRSIYTHQEINGYCVATCDKDYLPSLRELRKNGKAIRLYYRKPIARILADEIEWLNGDGFSAAVDLEELAFFQQNPFGQGST